MRNELLNHLQLDDLKGETHELAETIGMDAVSYTHLALRVRHPVQPDNTGHRRIAETALRGCRAGADRPVPDDGKVESR